MKSEENKFSLLCIILAAYNLLFRPNLTINPLKTVVALTIYQQRQRLANACLCVLPIRYPSLGIYGAV